MKTRYLAILATLTFLVFSVPAFAPPRNACEDWPSCKDDVVTPPSEDNSGTFIVDVFFEPTPSDATQAASVPVASEDKVVGEDDDRRPGVGPTDMDLNIGLMDTDQLMPVCDTVFTMHNGRFNISTAKLKHREIFTFVTATFSNFKVDGVAYGVGFVGNSSIDVNENWLPAPDVDEAKAKNTLRGDELQLEVSKGPLGQGPCNGIIKQNWKIEVTNEELLP